MTEATDNLPVFYAVKRIKHGPKKGQDVDGASFASFEEAASKSGKMADTAHKLDPSDGANHIFGVADEQGYLLNGMRNRVGNEDPRVQVEQDAEKAKEFAEKMKSLKE